MTDGYLNIRFESLQQAQTDLSVAYNAAKSLIDELKAKLEQNLDAWSGPARDEYNRVKGDWDKAFAHMADVLNKAHVHIGSAHEMYQEVEKQNLTIWRN
jgi:WXG100 family type VII secretion target